MINIRNITIKDFHYLFVSLCINAFIIILSPVYCSAQTISPKVTYSYYLKTSGTTSAGIFTKDGTLIKSLWNAEHNEQGTHNVLWDGTDNEGKTVPKGSYVLKILSNNVKYTWEGVVGNTSDAFTGPSVHRSHFTIQSLAIVGNTAYYATGYNEQGSGIAKFSLSNPQKRIALTGKGLDAKFVATDGINIYWAGSDAGNHNNSFVFFTSVADDSETSFSEGGAAFKTRYARAYKSTIDTYSNGDDAASGMAVQQNGPYLFIAHQSLNMIKVFDKKTGTLIKTASVNTPGQLAEDGNGNLWVTLTVNNNKTIAKYKIKSNGELAPTPIMLTGLANPAALAVSPDKKTLLVADASQSQQIKAYDNKSGLLKLTYGKENGYAASPDVSDDKFYFSDKRSTLGSAIAYQSDGSFWVEDSGNCRLQHFTAGFKFINRLMYLNTSYSIAVDVNNPQRIFSDYLEFKVDYTKPLAANNGSWTLVKNWGATVPPELDNKYVRMHALTTLANNHTYTTFYNRKLNNWIIAELPAHGPLRFTNSGFNNDYTKLYPDGSLRKMTPVKAGQPITWSERPLLNFDSDNNPVWGEEKVLASIPVAAPSDPIPMSNLQTIHPADITSSNLIIMYGNGASTLPSLNFHLGAIGVGAHSWKWEVAPGTDRSYTGPFPSDGQFDNGNHVRYAGSVALVKDRSIFWGYYGEFWKNTEVNKWTHVYDDGLMVGQFGATGADVGIKGADAPAKMAGNAFSAELVKDGNGNMYLYHNDESQHGGIHRWKITGLNTIVEQSVQIKL